jgi:hypothetical protein
VCESLFSGSIPYMCKLKALVIPRPSFWSVKMEGVGQV